MPMWDTFNPGKPPPMPMNGRGQPAAQPPANPVQAGTQPMPQVQAGRPPPRPAYGRPPSGAMPTPMRGGPMPPQGNPYADMRNAAIQQQQRPDAQGGWAPQAPMRGNPMQPMQGGQMQDHAMQAANAAQQNGGINPQTGLPWGQQPANRQQQVRDMMAQVRGRGQPGGRAQPMAPPQDAAAKMRAQYEQFNQRGKPIASQANLVGNQMPTYRQSLWGGQRGNPGQPKPGRPLMKGWGR